MQQELLQIALMVLLLPLGGALVAGLLGKVIGRRLTHRITILLVGISFLLAVYIFNAVVLQGVPSVEGTLYTWVWAGAFKFNVGLLVDHLSASMMLVVTFVSLAVHIYSIGYMDDDPGYQRFFSYVSLFTFSMLALVLSNNFLFLFFGWEGVGLVSYLLIGFWFEKESAVQGGLKAFIVNRVGDMGFILALAALTTYFGGLGYHDIFNHLSVIDQKTISIIPGHPWSVYSVICILLFVGAMAKSAQIPLHVWLPESMEGPTPISALIHAATMVTAGIYMVARSSPLFEHSEVALSVLLIVGATTCLLMGILAIVQFDIKRLIAYSTLSQLGYMVVALGASAYAAGIFHLITHAFFKALLFLGAGSVIVALHHEQDMRKMGGLWKYMPVTYVTFLVGSIALAAIPPFAGFYSKESIIEAVHISQIPGAGYAYICVLFGAMLTALYTFRGFFITFHTQERFDAETKKHLHETPWVIWLPLVLLAIPSMLVGFILVKPLLFNHPGLLGDSIFVLPAHDVLNILAKEFHGPWHMAVEALQGWPLILTAIGILLAWLFNVRFLGWTIFLKKRFSWIYGVLLNKYGFDEFYYRVLMRGCHMISNLFYRILDVKIIDGWGVNGAGRSILNLSRVIRFMQSGQVTHYAFVMLLGLCAFLGWQLL